LRLIINTTSTETYVCRSRQAHKTTRGQNYIKKVKITIRETFLRVKEATQSIPVETAAAAASTITSTKSATAVSVSASTASASTPVAASASSTSAALLSGEIDANGPLLAILAVEVVDRLLGFPHGPHGHEAKALGTPGLLVVDDLDVTDTAGLGKEAGQVFFSGLEGQIAHIQSLGRHFANKVLERAAR